MTTTAPAPSAGMTAFALQTPWLDRTGWDRTYSNKGQREVLATLTRTCTSPGGQEYFVGSGKVYGLEDDIVSPGEDEDRIACLVRLVDVVMSRCEETARKTSRHILCWLRSNQASSIYGKPFTLVQSSSTSKYRLLLKRCLAMVCRIYRLHPDRRIKTHEALGDLAALNELIGRHKCQVDHAQEVAGGHRESHSENTNTEGEEEEDDDEDEEESEKDEEEGEGEEEEEGSNKQENNGGFTAWLEDLGEITEEEGDQMEEEAGAARGSPEELVELLFGLTLAIATQPVINGQPQTTVLIYFSGILGFSLSPGGGAFLPARSYTSNLSGLVYILRLVLLEYALPLRAYPTLAL
ncbi:telomere-associated helicase [Fusarium beomiforme]|uniref:Telomere-associated helicase n=1 Tax=Fusarium beomiforme TaxID=44412 RepID=A0A9P5AVV2_9HYPO|nr:telomere-associated helicase [Fusarium beomiforme]